MLASLLHKLFGRVGSRSSLLSLIGIISGPVGFQMYQESASSGSEEWNDSLMSLIFASTKSPETRPKLSRHCHISIYVYIYVYQFISLFWDNPHIDKFFTAGGPDAILDLDPWLQAATYGTALPQEHRNWICCFNPWSWVLRVDTEFLNSCGEFAPPDQWLLEGSARKQTERFPPQAEGLDQRTCMPCQLMPWHAELSWVNLRTFIVRNASQTCVATVAFVWNKNESTSWIKLN